MTDLVTRLLMWWVRFYTRDLPEHEADRRIREIDADVHDHVTHEREAGVGEGRIALGLASRGLRGIAADLAWRGPRRQAAPRGGRASLRRSGIRIALGVGLVLLLPLVAMQFSEDVVWTPGDFVAAGIMLALIGVVIEVALRRTGSRIGGAGVAAFGLAAAVAGEADDAPGLVFLGLMLVAGGLAIGVRTTQGRR